MYLLLMKGFEIDQLNQVLDRLTPFTSINMIYHSDISSVEC